VQVFEIVATVAIVLAVLAGAGLFVVYKRLQRYQRNQRVIMGSRGSVDIVEHVSSVDEKLANVRLALEDVTLAVRDHDVRIDSGLSRVGIVRFDAYYDLGGRQSTSVAFLNSLGDGVILTTVVSRDFARIYVKLIKDGQPDVPLAPEETEAMDQARGSSPFTIKPRVDGGSTGDGGARADGDSTAEGALMSTGLPGLRPQNEREVARENRKRKRRGLPYVQGEVVPSAKGWGEPETPSAASLAERFVRERKGSLNQSDDDDWLTESKDRDEDDREL
jgi:hypothetical protein